MNILHKMSISVLLLALTLLSCSKCTEPKNNDTGVPKLVVEGKKLLDENGKTVELQGVSFGWHNWWPQFYNSGCIKTLKEDWKATVVRAAMGVEPDGAYLDNPENSKRTIYRVVDAAIKNDMYAIVDWHSHSLLLEEAKTFFTEVATKYKDVNNVIYEIYNEPVDETWAEIKAYSTELIKTIRAIDKDALILVSAPRWSQNLDEVAQNPIKGETNIMYVLHFYAGTHKKELRDKADIALKNNLPVFVSECAGMLASGDGPIDIKSWNDWYSWIKANKLSWVAWSVTNKEETCSMLEANADEYGNWDDNDIKPWGKIVRAALRGESYELLKSGDETLDISILENNNWVFNSINKPEIIIRLMAEGESKGELKLEIHKDTKEDLAEYTKSYDLSSETSDITFPLSLEPGFYKISVSNNNNIIKEFNIGYEPEKIVSKADRPADFYEFWEKAKNELASTDPEYDLELIKDKSSKYRELYLVKMKSIEGETISGYLAVPVDKSKKYPVYINYMGYGSKPWEPGTDWESNTIDFVLSTRGQGINEPNNKYGDWIVNNLDNKDKYYYRGAYMDLVRAVDFVTSLEYSDKDNIFAEGGSQGGAFTLIACSLDKRIKAAAPTVPFLSDFPDYLRIAEWPTNVILAAQKELGISDADLYKTLSYFDVKNFTESIECPILMNVGLQDVVCPPHTNMSGYNLIKSEKSLHIFIHQGHGVDMEEWTPIRNAFFEKNLK